MDRAFIGGLIDHFGFGIMVRVPIDSTPIPHITEVAGPPKWPIAKDNMTPCDAAQWSALEHMYMESSDGKCVACLDTDTETHFRPCRHTVMCCECCLRIEKMVCPMCRAIIEEVVAKHDAIVAAEEPVAVTPASPPSRVPINGMTAEHRTTLETILRTLRCAQHLVRTLVCVTYTAVARTVMECVITPLARVRDELSGDPAREWIGNYLDSCLMTVREFRRQCRAVPINVNVITDAAAMASFAIDRAATAFDHELYMHYEAPVPRERVVAVQVPRAHVVRTRVAAAAFAPSTRFMHILGRADLPVHVTETLARTRPIHLPIPRQRPTPDPS